MRYLMFLLVLMFVNVAQAVDCDVMPTCEELGYSKADDPYCADNGYMYCPLDHSYKKCVNMDCAKLGFTEDDKTSWCGKLAKCQGNPKMTLCQNLCEIGDVFYADGTCGYVEDYDASLGKIPVGVVYYVTDNGRHGKVINLHDLGRSSASADFNPAKPYETGYSLFAWGVSSSDIEGLKNWDCTSFLTTAKTENRSDPLWSDGKNYTDIIAKALGHDLKYAAPAVSAFYPPEVRAVDSKVGEGHWYLPTIGEFMDLYGYNYSSIGNLCGSSSGAIGENKKAVNATLIALQKKGVDAKELSINNYYWTSSEVHATAAWEVALGNGIGGHHPKSNEHYVRASLAF